MVTNATIANFATVQLVAIRTLTMLVDVETFLLYSHLNLMAFKLTLATHRAFYRQHV